MHDPCSRAFCEEFGAHLVKSGVIDVAAQQRSARAAIASGGRFDRVLTQLGLISENDLAFQLALFLGLPLLDRADIPSHPILPDLVETAFVTRHGVLPIAVGAAVLTLAVRDPLDPEPLRALVYLTNLAIETCVIAPADFERAVAALYDGKVAPAGQSEIDIRAGDAAEFDLQRLRDLASEAPIIRLVNQLVAAAVEAGASDIHIEPGPDVGIARLRIDGVLRKVQAIPAPLQAAVASRIKIMSRLDIAERRLPQDGRIKLAVRGVDIDFRVSTIPTIFGESIVMRILDRRAVELDFVKLGFANDVIAALRSLMREPNGIVLVTGPTGSGKTTSLYTALREINRPESKVFTVEDPIEYQLAGVNQVQTQASIGLDFPQALRAILRQDPDIVMIGEIRDLETARIAIQASLTGHLVFSTLHTNSAVASIARLIDMGVENYLLASTIKGVLAQRLVRRLCEVCAIDDPHAETWTMRTPEPLRAGSPSFKRPVGCEACNGSGFRGRSTIAELMIVDAPLQALIHASAPDSELERQARASGMWLLHEDGLAKVWRGETSVDEVLRVTRAS